MRRAWERLHFVLGYGLRSHIASWWRGRRRAQQVNWDADYWRLLCEECPPLPAIEGGANARRLGVSKGP